MLDLKYIRENLEFLKEHLKFRNFNLNLDNFLELDNKRSFLIQESESFKNRKNVLSDLVAKTKDSYYIEEATSLSKKIKVLDSELEEVEKLLHSLLSNIPNVCDADVPLALDESENKVLYYEGNPKEGREHTEILGSLYEGERAAKISGSRFIVLRGKAAYFERMLANIMIDHHISKGYEEYSLPQIVKEQSMFNSGQLPKFAEDAYSFDNCYLIPTGEVPLVNMFAKEILLEESLTKKMVALTHCFRKESGSYGKDTKGLIRVHQFSKVELFKITKPEDSDNELKGIVADAESILKLLQLPYRVVLKCTGDTSFTAAKTYDIEVWFPSQQAYREISSCSNTRDFQSRRSGIKYRSNNKTYFPHLLNGSGLAVGRTLAAFVENHGLEKGEEILNSLKGK